jgi:hypothetical protein
VLNLLAGRPATANHFVPSNFARAPNKSLQRSVNHKVFGRGRVVSAPSWAPRARELTSQPAAAELSR